VQRRLALGKITVAVRRCGELLKQINPANGARTDLEPRAHHRPELTREHAAKDAGLSERQRKTAPRIVNVPEEQFDEAVESNDPPTREGQG
jgi:hypothetical protein